MRKNSLISIFILSLIFVVTSCNNKKESFGLPLTNSSITNISDILAKPVDFESKSVKIEGEIVDECPGGHWFDIKDKSGMIYVELSGFVIPQMVKQTITVEGEVKTQDGKTMIVGKGVQPK